MDADRKTQCRLYLEKQDIFQLSFLVDIFQAFSFPEYFGSTELRDVNVVSVDWRYLSSIVDYFAAAEHTVTAGRRAGQILKDLLINQLGQQPRRIHAIGHRYIRNRNV